MEQNKSGMGNFQTIYNLMFEDYPNNMAIDFSKTDYVFSERDFLLGQVTAYKHILDRMLKEKG